MRLLELFSGTKSVSRVAKPTGWETMSLDIDPKHNPGLFMDDMDFETTTWEKRQTKTKYLYIVLCVKLAKRWYCKDAAHLAWLQFGQQEGRGAAWRAAKPWFCATRGHAHATLLSFMSRN